LGVEGKKKGEGAPLSRKRDTKSLEWKKRPLAVHRTGGGIKTAGKKEGGSPFPWKGNVREPEGKKRAKKGEKW